MKKIKTWLIHLLGGVTVTESRKRGKKSFYLGMEGTCIDIRDYAEYLYGKPADEWCKLMYEFICGLQESLTHGTDEERSTAQPTPTRKEAANELPLLPKERQVP